MLAMADDVLLILAAVVTGVIGAAGIIVASTWLDRREDRKWRL